MFIVWYDNCMNMENVGSTYRAVNTGYPQRGWNSGWRVWGVEGY